MEKLQTLEDRLEWCKRRKLERDPSLSKIPNTVIAKEAGVSRGAVGFWFRSGGGLKSINARKLARYFDVDPVWLETGEGTPEPKKAQQNTQALGGVLSPTIQTAAEMRLIAVYRLCGEKERQIIDSQIDLIEAVINKRP